MVFETFTDLIDEFLNSSDIWYFKLALVIFGLVLARFITKQVLYKVVERTMSKNKYSTTKERLQRRNTLVSVLSTVLTILYVLTALVLTLGIFGIDITAMLAGLAGLGVVIGIAGQSAIKDFLMGFSILFYDQMRVGDIVEIAGKSGVVDSINLQIVRLRDLDGYVHVVPNSEITTVTNMSHEYANVNLDIGVAYDSDVDKVEKIINEVGNELFEDRDFEDRFLEPIQFLRVDSFGDSAVNIKALGKVRPAEQWGIAGEFRRRLKKAFEKAGIEIPFPQRVIHQAKSKK